MSKFLKVGSVVMITKTLWSPTLWGTAPTVASLAVVVKKSHGLGVGAYLSDGVNDSWLHYVHEFEVLHTPIEVGDIVMFTKPIFGSGGQWDLAGTVGQVQSMYGQTAFVLMSPGSGVAVDVKELEVVG